jgi:hypothetical protein
VVFIPLTVVRLQVTVVLKEPFLGWQNNSVERLNSVFGLEKVDQKPYNSSIKPMETMQCDRLRFSSGGSASETEKRTLKMNLAEHLFHYPPEACSKRSATRFREVSGAL